MFAGRQKCWGLNHWGKDWFWWLEIKMVLKPWFHSWILPNFDEVFLGLEIWAKTPLAFRACICQLLSLVWNLKSSYESFQFGIWSLRSPCKLCQGSAEISQGNWLCEDEGSGRIAVQARDDLWNVSPFWYSLSENECSCQDVRPAVQLLLMNMFEMVFG